MGDSIALGSYARVPAGTSGGAIVIGANAGISAANQRVILITNNLTLDSGYAGNDTVMIGASLQQTSADCSNSVQLGILSKLGGSNSVAIGREAKAETDQATAIGPNTTANANGSSAIGDGATANFANTATVKELETSTVGGGIRMYSPNGTAYKLTVSDAGAPVFTAV